MKVSKNILLSLAVLLDSRRTCGAEDTVTCNLSCKSCLPGSFEYTDPSPDVYPGFAEKCLACEDGTDLFWFQIFDDVSFGYCESSRCASEIAAFETCLAENKESCPATIEQLQAFPGHEENTWSRKSGNELAGTSTITQGNFNDIARNMYLAVKDNICFPIVGLMDGLTFSAGANPDCPCAPQLYEQMYCLNDDKISLLLKSGLTVDGRPMGEKLPMTSPDNPRENFCGPFAKPKCSAVDVEILLGVGAEGCLDNECNIIPDCKCVKECGTCGWWDSLDDVSWYNDNPKKGAGDPGTGCTSCKKRKVLTSEWGGRRGSGHCWDSAAPATPLHGAIAGSMASMLLSVFLFY